MNLNEIKGIGKKTEVLLNKLGIFSYNDLITYYPFRYELLKRSDINTLEQDDKIIIDGVLESIPTVYFLKRRLDKMSFRINTSSRLINVIIFNRRFLKNSLPIGKLVTIIGKYDKKNNLIIASDIKLRGLKEQEELEPVYNTTYGISSKQISNLIKLALTSDYNIKSLIPSSYQDKYHLLDKNKAIKVVHNPNDYSNLKEALNTLKYEELFIFMMKMNYLKLNTKNELGLERNVSYSLVESFITSLPFTLTVDQLKAVNDIYDDLISPHRMNRLLQGDVGSGKTVVSIIAIYINYLSHYQSALMAPTEILAHQHYDTIKKLFKGTNINVSLLTGKLKVKEKKEIYEGLKAGKIDLVIGTHAILEDTVIFNNLGLVITDEQHRFGVNQRANLKNKGITPDILYMSATPIPRTYALTLYGDMDISNIKTMPKGRKEIITYIKKDIEIKDTLALIYEELKHHHQVYVIAPLIFESDKIDLENTKDLEEKMNKAFGNKYKVASLHGKMTSSEKETIMTSFKNNEIQILVSTTVVEVGVDVPNATMMVIFDSYRFGLSTLHQLRGRVGRSELQSYCLLISNYEKERLNILTKTNDGFLISEEDFKLRGSGDLFGTKQSGDMVFKVANIKNDFNMFLKAKEDSFNYLISNDYQESDLRQIIENSCNQD